MRRTNNHVLLSIFVFNTHLYARLCLLTAMLSFSEGCSIRTCVGIQRNNENIPFSDEWISCRRIFLWGFVAMLYKRVQLQTMI